MTRMTREFSLVLLGSSMLAGGYLMWPENDLEAKAEEQAQQRVGGSRGTSGHRTHVIFISRYGGSTISGGRAPAMASVSRGGLGSIGARVGGGA